MFTSKDLLQVISPAAAENELNIKDVIAQRVSAVRNLNTNPNDINAMKDMADIQNKVKADMCFLMYCTVF